MVLADKTKFDVEHPELHPVLKAILVQVKNVFEEEGFFFTTTTTTSTTTSA